MTKAQLLATLNSSEIPHDAVVTNPMPDVEEQSLTFTAANDQRVWRTDPIGATPTRIVRTADPNGDVVEIPIP